MGIRRGAPPTASAVERTATCPDPCSIPSTIAASEPPSRRRIEPARLASRPSELVAHAPRFAGGFGFDLFGTRVDLGRFAFSVSADGVRLLFNLGPSAASGDRQNRN